MQLGFVSAILPDLTLEQVLRVAAREGYACVEVMCWPRGKAERRYAGVTHIDVANLSDGDVARIQALVAETGVSISGLGYYPNPLAPDPSEAAVYCEHLRKVIAAAQRLGIGVVNTFIGRDWTRSVEDNWPRLLETWRPLLRHAEERGVRIGIENCPMLFTRDEWPGGKNIAISPEIWRRLFADLESPNLGLNYDPSHLVWQRMDYIRPLREFAARLFHIHAKDARVDVERLNEVGILAHPLQYHTPKLPGLGDVDWGRFFSVLSDVGYRGAVCVEVEDRAYEGTLALRQAALAQSARFLRQFMG
ncbi:MAG: sugar phosphate isomerase/epimerase family protein [Anaerolineae bacterium]